MAWRVLTIARAKLVFVGVHRRRAFCALGLASKPARVKRTDVGGSTGELSKL